jgi:hypothetical protein
MATTDQIDGDALKSIGEQISSHLPSPPPLPPGSGPLKHRIAESFSVWTIADHLDPGRPLGPAGTEIRNAAQYTNTCHHQIARDQYPAPQSRDPITSTVVATALSRPGLTSAEWKLLGVTIPTRAQGLPRHISTVAHWIDENAPGNPIVRLLVIPSRYLYCFWLFYEDKDKIVAIDMPRSFTHLHTGVIYDLIDFFDKLTLEPAVGGLGRP